MTSRKLHRRGMGRSRGQSDQAELGMYQRVHSRHRQSHHEEEGHLAVQGPQPQLRPYAYLRPHCHACQLRFGKLMGENETDLI